MRIVHVHASIKYNNHLDKPSFYLSYIDGRVQTFSNVHHYTSISPQNLQFKVSSSVRLR